MKIVSKRNLGRLCNGAMELIFPPRCVCCGKMGEGIDGGICRECLADVPFCEPPLCLCCGRNFSTFDVGLHRCGMCLKEKPPFTTARAITFYEEPVRSLLHRLKYGYETAVVDPLLEIAQSFEISRYDNCEIILPVPIHEERLRSRGMNQALVLARGIFGARKNDILSGVLKKTKKTPSQTELDGAGRRKNLKGAFSVKNPLIVRGKVVCVVDDVLTTGTTAAECSAELLRNGASEVHILTFSRVRE